MARYLIIDIDLCPPEPTLESKIYIFGKDLWHTMKASDLASIPLDEVTNVTSQFRVRIHSKKYVRRVEKSVQELLAEHFLLPRAHLSQVAES